MPLWCVGLWYLFAVPDGKRFRLLGWMYVVSLLAFLFAKGRDYYLAPAYPMLLAAGAVWGEQWVRSLSTRSALTVRRITWTVLAVAGLAAAAVTLPVAPLNSTWWRVATLSLARLRPCSQNTQSRSRSLTAFQLALIRMQRNFERRRKQVEGWRAQQLSAEAANLTIYRAFIENTQ